MAINPNEQEQIDQIKTWWQENGRLVVISVLVFAAVIFGGQFFKKSKEAKSVAASAEYQVMLLKMQQNSAIDAMQIGEKIVLDYHNTPYALQAALLLAKIYIDGAQKPDKKPEDKKASLDKAATHLRRVVEQAAQSPLQHLARVRLARLLTEMDQYDQALSLLNGVEPGKMKEVYEEIKGDIYYAQGKVNEARDAYRRSLEGMETGSDRSTLLQMKLNHLSTEKKQAG